MTTGLNLLMEFISSSDNPFFFFFFKFVVQETQEIDLCEKKYFFLLNVLILMLKTWDLSTKLSSTKISSNHREFKIVSVEYHVGA